MPRGKRGGNRASAANPEAPAPGLTPESSTFPVKVTLKANINKKKVKKWAPLDLSTLESGSEADILDAGVDQPRSGYSSPTPPASLEVPSLQVRLTEVTTTTSAAVKTTGLTALVTDFKHQHHFNEQETLLVVTDKGRGRQSEYFDPDPTPTQASFSNFSHLTPTQVSFNSFAYPFPVGETIQPEDRDLSRQSDSNSVKGQFEDIMSRIDSAFDVEEWSTSIPTGLENNSPEQLTVKPQPVTYTTVGSLAKSNDSLKFTAPVRLQRDGVPRRPLATSANQARGLENFFTGRTPAQNNMGFGTQGPPYNLPSKPINAMPVLTAAEVETLHRQGRPTTLIGNSHYPFMATSAMRDNLTGQTSSIAHFNESGRANEMTVQFESERPGQPLSTQSSVPDFKMQTLQRLAQFPNPMQQSAKERLSSLAIGNTSQKSISGSSFGQAGPEFTMNPQAARVLGQGVLDYNFSFPGSESGKTSQIRHGSSNRVSSVDSMPTKESVYQLNQLPPGYPRPLTAGPPRQRPVAIGTKGPQTSFEGMPATSQSVLLRPPNILKPVESQPNYAHPNYPWFDMNTNCRLGFEIPRRPFTSNMKAEDEIRNTAPISQVARYYPNGWPPEMSSEFGYLPQKEIDKDMGIESRRTLEEEEQKKQDDWWYSGLRKARKNVEEHFSDGAQRDLERERGNTVAPSVSPPPFDNKTYLKVSQVDKMSATEVSAPLLDGLFGSILAYADEHYSDPTTKTITSKFYISPQWQLDTSEKGKNSFFGDDIGPTPKRLGRDPRYHHNDQNNP